MLKIAIVVSHPIQHFCPQYVSFARHKKITLKVFFGSALGYKKYLDENFKQEISWDNLNLHLFDHVFLNGETVLPADRRLDAINLERALADFRPQLVIGYGYFQKLQRRAKRWANAEGVPVAYISDAEARQVRHPIKTMLKQLLVAKYFRSIKYFLTVGDANEAFYRRHGVKEAQLLRMHFPIDLITYKAAYAEKDILNIKTRNRYDIGISENVLVVVGKLSPWKNQDHIIDAMKLLEDKAVITHLFILGSGEMEAAWKKKAALLKHSKVHFPGFVSINDLPAYYAAADLYVHPASVEPHSIAISEAIYMGCPIVLSDRCGSYGDTDDVKEGENGIVFPFGNIAALAGAIQRLVSDKNLREAFAAKSHLRAVAFQQVAHQTIIDKLVERVALNSPANKI
jgi:glycosyltransferase involved in cell wall biosynthesis